MIAAKTYGKLQEEVNMETVAVSLILIVWFTIRGHRIKFSQNLLNQLTSVPSYDDVHPDLKFLNINPKLLNIADVTLSPLKWVITFTLVCFSNFTEV